MNGSEHYRAAEAVMAVVDEMVKARRGHVMPIAEANGLRSDVATSLAAAQVHATLALAAPKPLPVVEIRRPNDDQLDLLVNGREVASANHDEHGWSGMDAFEKAATAIVKAFGGEIGEAEVSEDDDDV